MFHLLTATDANERLTELERFIEFWYGPRRPEFGEPDVATAYPDLPEPLQRFYAFAGRWPSTDPDDDEDYFYTGASGHHLLPAGRVRATDAGQLHFFMEYQGDWYGVTTPREADPPVWISGRWDDPDDPEETADGPEPQPKTRQVAAALSKFLVTHCLMTTVYEWVNSPRPRTSSHKVETALADWFRRDRSASELLWRAEPNGCPNYEGSFHLLHGHVLVHEIKPGRLKFGALHPEGVELLRGVLGDDA